MPERLTLDGSKQGKHLQGMGYAKLFSSITESSLWSEPKEVRLLFVSMLARARWDGFVEASLPGLARLSNLSFSEVEAAIEVLSNPDKHSMNNSYDGRRIQKVPGGWMVLNYEDYRNRKSEEDRREYMREYMEKYRSRKQDVSSSKQVNKTPSVSNSASDCLIFPEALDNDSFRAVWKKWEAHRKEIKKPLTVTQRGEQLAKLADMGLPRAVAALEHTIFKGWQGIREPDRDDMKQAKGDAPKGVNVW